MSINTIPLGYARMNVNGCRTSFVITSVCSSIHNPFQAHSLQHSCHPIRSRPTAYSTVTIQFVPDPQPTAQLPSNPFQAHSLQHSYHPIRSRPTAYSTVTIQSVPVPQPTAQLPSNSFQAHSLQHSYHPTQQFEQEKYNKKSKI